MKAKLPTRLHSKLAKAQAMAMSGQYIAALQLLAEMASKAPDNADVWFMQGVILGLTMQPEGALAALQRAVALRPTHALSYFNLGNVLVRLGRHAEAASAFEKAIRLEPGKPEIAQMLAGARLQSGDYDGAAESFQRYLEHDPNNPAVNAKLAACYFYLGKLEAAATYYGKALAVEPMADRFDGLGAVLCQQGKYDEAIHAHREAMRLDPGSARIHSNYLLTLNYLPDAPPEKVLAEHKEWARLHPMQRKARHQNDPDPSRRIRVGYVSPDLRIHSVTYFFESLLRHHNKEVVEIFCYACSSHRDEVTARLQGAADHWCDISGMSDEQACNRILADGIDILVDLSGHTAHNRLTLFTLKPAPLQVTYLGYPNTTGLSVMDYRITDELADPVGSEKYFTEELLRVPGCFLSYAPPSDAPPVSVGPMAKNGFITFGSFNNLAKINETVIALWSKLLSAVPSSRLIIKNPSLTDHDTAKRYQVMFERHGVQAERLDLLGLAPTRNEHLDSYRLMDVALDTFPYNGTTTTCEALYMGLPVITLRGEVHAGRVGWSLLSAVGLEEFAAKDIADYIDAVISLAANTSRVASLRQSLRDRLSHSRLSDGSRLAKDIEMAYREIWRRWCVSVSSVAN